MAKTRILVTCDLHGSETCWRKSLNASKMFKADVMIVNGDLTAKIIIPIMRSNDGYETQWSGQPIRLRENQVADFEAKCRMSGYIPYQTTKEEAAEIQANEHKREALFELLEAEVMRHWLSLVPQRVGPEVKIILTPGNDDKFSVDAVIRENERVIFGSDDVHMVDDEHEILCSGWTNPTPWDTPREIPDEKLYRILRPLAEKVRDWNKAILCTHCPPFNSTIDVAPLLDATLKPVVVGGSPQFVPVGSKSVRSIIEEYQPLLAFHGHIHEAPGRHRIGRTECTNPGSEYTEGIFKGFLVEIDGKNISKLQRVEG